VIGTNMVAATTSVEVMYHPDVLIDKGIRSSKPLNLIINIPGIQNGMYQNWLNQTGAEKIFELETQTLYLLIVRSGHALILPQ